MAQGSSFSPQTQLPVFFVQNRAHVNGYSLIISIPLLLESQFSGQDPSDSYV